MREGVKITKSCGFVFADGSWFAINQGEARRDDMAKALWSARRSLRQMARNRDRGVYVQNKEAIRIVIELPHYHDVLPLMSVCVKVAEGQKDELLKRLERSIRVP